VEGKERLRDVQSFHELADATFAGGKLSEDREAGVVGEGLEPMAGGGGAADQLLRYDWPGNVRELENAMERAVALGRANLIELDELPEEVRQAIPIPSVSGPVGELDEIEKDYILAVLDLNTGNQTRTAEQLGIGSATLHRKLKSYGVARGIRAPGGEDSAPR
jgi:DNA-binding NtrC family response regulator